jgi:molecular chaperone HscB
MQSPLFCEGCHTLYPADTATHFELLGVPFKFDLDPAELRRKYLTVSRGIHPDRAGDDNAALSLRASARLNDAYRVLSDPLLRADYLLELSGGRSSAGDKTVPQEVLNQTLLLRDEIEEARMAADQAALAAAQATVKAAYNRIYALIAALAARLPGDEALRRELRVALNSIRYYQRALAQFE